VAHDWVLWTDRHTLCTRFYDNKGNKDCLWCLEPAHTSHFLPVISVLGVLQAMLCIFTTHNQKTKWEHWVVEFVGSGTIVLIKSHACHHNRVLCKVAVPSPPHGPQCLHIACGAVSSSWWSEILFHGLQDKLTSLKLGPGRDWIAWWFDHCHCRTLCGSSLFLMAE
jgi:hypothetical protein